MNVKPDHHAETSLYKATALLEVLEAAALEGEASTEALAAQASTVRQLVEGAQRQMGLIQKDMGT